MAVWILLGIVGVWMVYDMVSRLNALSISAWQEEVGRERDRIDALAAALIRQAASPSTDGPSSASASNHSDRSFRTANVEVDGWIPGSTTRAGNSQQENIPLLLQASRKGLYRIEDQFGGRAAAQAVPFLHTVSAETVSAERTNRV